MTDMTTRFNSFIFDSSPKSSTEINVPNVPVIHFKQGQKIWKSEPLMEMFFTHSLEGIWFMRDDFLEGS
jgi:hypothetical protein